MIIYKKFLLFLSVLVNVSCGRLQYDNTKAYPLLTVSTSETPATEDIRNFVQYGDLVYTAAGSGGILVYRIIGDAMDPVLPLSLTNLHSEGLERVYVRTLEIVETEKNTSLVFAYDTLAGGGIGVAEITDYATKPLGSLKIKPNIRIKNTVTTYDPRGVYRILAASENIGVVSYELSFISNSYFEQSNIASLVDYVSLSDIEGPAQVFLSLDAPSFRNITNIGQITNVENLVQLALDNPQMFSSIVSNIPFLTLEQKTQIEQILAITNQPFISNILDIARTSLGQDLVNQMIANPNSLNSLLNSPVLAGVLPEVLDVGNLNKQNSPLQQIQSNLTPTMISEAEKILGNQEQGLPGIPSADVQNILSLSSLQQVVQNQQDVEIFDNELLTESNQKTDTLFEESFLSNLNLAGEIDTALVHDTNYNPFIEKREIGDAGVEIQKTVDSLGRTFFVEEDIELKNRILELTEEEIQLLFASLFEQASSAIQLIPLFESSGVNVRELYQFWVEGDYYSIVNQLNANIIAELLRKLPRYNIQSLFQVQKTNVNLPAIKNMDADIDTLYIAAGMEGFYIVDRLSEKIISSQKTLFSDVMMVVPYTVYGENYYVVADKLDGLIIYERKKDRSIGKQVSRIALVGEPLSVYPYEDILWVADGSDGVLAVRFQRDQSLVVEAELYDKQGIAYFIGSARRREVLASYGADGLKRLRITNVLPKNINTSSETLVQEKKVEEDEDFVDRVLFWSDNSAVAQFLKRIFF